LVIIFALWRSVGGAEGLAFVKKVAEVIAGGLRFEVLIQGADA